MFKKLLPFLNENDIFLITSPHGLRYFTGFSGGEGAAVIGKKLKILITDSRYTEAAKNEAYNFVVTESSSYFSPLKDIVTNNGIENIFYEDYFLTVSLFEKIKEIVGNSVSFKAYSFELEKLRMKKNEFELCCIKKAEQICSNAFKNVLSKIKAGMTELELAAEIEYFMKKSGAQKTSFDTIVISGKKTSMPHGMPDNKKLNYGDFITMDFGYVYNGYCSDMTRTIVLGKANEEQRKIYDVVLNAQLTALEFLSAGKTAKEADSIARNVIEKAGYGKFFGHSLGHGVGLLIHELPNLSPNSEFILEENMVVSCEPGIYIPDFGGVRIEDLVVIIENGIVNLTDAEKKLIEI